MIDGSVRRRLVGGGVAAIVLALALVGLGLTLLFERHLERSALVDLDIHLRQIVSGLELDSQGNLLIARAPTDPRFLEPLSGLYWQVDEEHGRQHRSRSLWDTTLPTGTENAPIGRSRQFIATGPTRSQMLVLERRVTLDFAKTPHPVRVAVAVSLQRIAKARTAFARELSIALGMLAVVLAAAMVLQVHMGLQPLAELRDQVVRVRAGTDEQFKTPVPVEVRPLVEELNALIVKHKAEVERSQRRAADLAHGLKTPLAALAGDAQRLRALGQHAVADDIENVGDAMNRYVTRELARARSRGTSSEAIRASCDLLPLVQLLKATLSRTPEGEAIDYDIDVPAELSLPIDRTDLAEVLGNLLENATRHARSRVRIRARTSAAGPCVTIDDDGAGLPPERRAIVLDRGARLDTQGNGAGIGLAIVQDLLEGYGWRLSLESSPLGGLTASIQPVSATAALDQGVSRTSGIH